MEFLGARSVFDEPMQGTSTTVEPRVISQRKETSFERICLDGSSVRTQSEFLEKRKQMQEASNGGTDSFLRGPFPVGYTRWESLQQLGSNEFGDKWPEIPANM
ncbi:hypothetical protein KM043_018007 [Ampulex compressa]|nr:hypothetical protein KM043_018007 [Ampulex compressa]